MRRRAAAALVACAALLCGCTVSQPSANDWRTSVSTSLHDAASEVATAQLALRHREAGDTWQAYAVTMLGDAEESVGAASDAVGALQTPRGLEEEASAAGDVLSRAEDVVEQARQALVAGGPIGVDLQQRLARVHRALTDQATALAGGS